MSWGEPARKSTGFTVQAQPCRFCAIEQGIRPAAAGDVGAVKELLAQKLSDTLFG